MEIPIQNIYYLLCYAWNHWEEGQAISIDSTESPELVDLFAQILIGGVNHLLRRGLDRGYLPVSEDTPRLRGRIDFDESLKRTLFPRAYAHCHFDELSHDVLHNQILKSTIRRLTGVAALDSELRERLARLHRRFDRVREIELSRLVFRRVQLHSNNAFYRFLMNVCELIQNNLFVSEETGESIFRDFLRDQVRLWELYEDFVYNFYRLEQQDYGVKPQSKLHWDANASTEALELLPTMTLDIILERDDHVIVIDTKFYRNTLQASNYRETFHSSHLYQMFAYLKNMEAKGGAFADADGVLLYPTVGLELDHEVVLGNHRLRMRTVDLGQGWREIRKSLLAMLDPMHAGVT